MALEYNEQTGDFEEKTNSPSRHTSTKKEEESPKNIWGCLWKCIKMLAIGYFALMVLSLLVAFLI